MSENWCFLEDLWQYLLLLLNHMLLSRPGLDFDLFLLGLILQLSLFEFCFVPAFWTVVLDVHGVPRLDLLL